MIKKLFPLVALVTLLTACGLVDSVKEANAQSELVAERLEKDLGAKPLISWNVNNGKLTNVNVIFKSTDVGSRRYDELEPVVRKAVEDGFKRKPSTLLISVQSSSP